MTYLKLITIFLITGFCCCKQKPVKHKVNPAAIELANKTIPLSSFFDNTDSCKKAIILLDSATAIDSNYFLGHYNKLKFLFKLKQYDKAILTTKNLIRIKPFANDFYLTAGILYELIGDTLSSKSYFKQSLVICNNVMDTINVNNSNYEMIASNKAVNLVMLGEGAKANELLKMLYDKQTNMELKKYILSMMNKNKGQLIEQMFNPKDSL